jgi:cation diffusion facilitator CzcD-associated flavoprotein CzcO
MSHTFFVHSSFGAIGPFGVPHYPEIYEKFDGRVVHTAKWNMSLEEFTGKRVAVVGSGSRYQKFLMS